MPEQQTQEGQQTTATTQEQPLIPGNGASGAPVIPEDGKQQGKNVILPSSALARIKGEQREKGKREAFALVEEKIKAAGFTSLDDAFSLLGQLKKGQLHQQPSQQPARKPDAKQPPVEGTQHLDEEGRVKNRAQYERERERWNKERSAFQRKAAESDRRTREIRRKLEAKEAEIALHDAAYAVGIKDVDYAQRLLTRHVAGLDEKALKSFDERAFFEGLREARPYLFGEIVRPATTGTGAGAPPSRQPGTVAKDAAASKQIDATKMTREEYAEHIRKLGFDAPGTV
jgi:hypothetical protein